jgi:hypothetical protein
MTQNVTAVQSSAQWGWALHDQFWNVTNLPVCELEWNCSVGHMCASSATPQVCLLASSMLRGRTGDTIAAFAGGIML